jgi:hypothetical protein
MLLMLSGATDGNVAVWALTPEEGFVASDPIATFKIHQSGVTALTAICHGLGVLVASGGDDNAIALLHLSVSQRAVTELTRTSVASAHAATVTGLPPSLSCLTF